jgi:hypothetical protein
LRPVHRAGGVAVLAHTIDQVGDGVGLDLVQRQPAQLGQDVDAKHRLIGLPTVLVSAHVRQIALGHEILELWHRAHFAALLLRVGPEQCLGYNLPRLATRLLDGNDVGRPDLVLPLAPAFVRIALIVRLAAGLADFEQEAALACVEEVGLLATGKALGLPDERGRKGNGRHYATTTQCSITRPRAILPDRRPGDRIVLTNFLIVCINFG